MSNHHRRLDAAAIKEDIDPHSFYLREQDLCRYGYRSGSLIVAGLCPFHEDRKPGSFKIDLETGSFKCFSCGGGGGDIIAFIMQKYGLSFRGALEKLAEEWEVRSC